MSAEAPSSVHTVPSPMATLANAAVFAFVGDGLMIATVALLAIGMPIVPHALLIVALPFVVTGIPAVQNKPWWSALMSHGVTINLIIDLVIKLLAVVRIAQVYHREEGCEARLALWSRWLPFYFAVWVDLFTLVRLFWVLSHALSMRPSVVLKEVWSLAGINHGLMGLLQVFRILAGLAIGSQGDDNSVFFQPLLFLILFWLSMAYFISPSVHKAARRLVDVDNGDDATAKDDVETGGGGVPLLPAFCHRAMAPALFIPKIIIVLVSGFLIAVYLAMPADATC